MSTSGLVQKWRNSASGLARRTTSGSLGTIVLEPALGLRTGQASFGGAETRQQIIEGLLMTS
jgi:hypothetical protein